MVFSDAFECIGYAFEIWLEYLGHFYLYQIKQYKNFILVYAAVVELVDTSDSKSDSRKGVTVQVRSAVPFNKSLFYAKLYKYLNNWSFFTGPYYIKKK